VLGTLVFLCCFTCHDGLYIPDDLFVCFQALACLGAINPASCLA
jgi:hypothetical protein